MILKFVLVADFILFFISSSSSEYSFNTNANSSKHDFLFFFVFIIKQVPAVWRWCQQLICSNYDGIVHVDNDKDNKNTKIVT